MDRFWAILLIVGAFTSSCKSRLQWHSGPSATNELLTLYQPPTSEQPLTKEYHVYTEFTANWYRAYHYCAQKNMQLATIDSDYEFNRLQRLISDTKCTEDFWIGLTKLGNQNFYWFGYKKPVTFNPWMPFVRHCTDCSCGVVNIDENQAFLARPCDGLGYIICESDISSPIGNEN